MGIEKRRCEHCGHIHVCAPPVRESQPKTGGQFGPSLARPPPHYLGNPAKQVYFNYFAKVVTGGKTDFKHGGNGKARNISFIPQTKDKTEPAPPEALPREELPVPLGSTQPMQEKQDEDDGLISSNDLERELMSEFNRNRPHLPTYPKLDSPDQQAPPADNRSLQEQNQDQQDQQEKKKKKWTSYKNWKSPE